LYALTGCGSLSPLTFIRPVLTLVILGEKFVIELTVCIATFNDFLGFRGDFMNSSIALVASSSIWKVTECNNYLVALNRPRNKTRVMTTALVKLLLLPLIKAEPHSDSHVAEADVCWAVSAHISLPFEQIKFVSVLCDAPLYSSRWSSSDIWLKTTKSHYYYNQLFLKSINVRVLLKVWHWSAPFVAHFLEMARLKVLQVFLNLLGNIVSHDCFHYAHCNFECICFLVGSWS